MANYIHPVELNGFKCRASVVPIKSAVARRLEQDLYLLL